MARMVASSLLVQVDRNGALQECFLSLTVTLPLLPAGVLKSVRTVDSKPGVVLSRSALVELSSVDEAVTALIGVHNLKMQDKYLRVSFARTGAR
jgi:hypothetical protein